MGTVITDNTAFDSTDTFQIIDSGSARIDLASRREIKYVLPGVDVVSVRRLLESNCRRLIHNQSVSVVNSVYFDDVHLSACRANLAGVGLRRKIRLRWYDSLEPQHDFFFEVKWRDNRITGKHRLQMRSERPLREMSYRQIVRNLDAVLPESLMRDFLTYTDPIVIVRYQREHFSSEDGLRLTLDYGISYYDQTGQSRLAMAFPRRLDGMVVLEGKTPPGREAELRQWLHPLAPRVGRCSKYVQGCVQIGRVAANES